MTTQATTELRSRHSRVQALMKQLTSAKDELLTAVLECRRASMTYDDIAHELGVSKSRVARLVRQAERMGARS